MGTVTVRNLTIGQGIPKICIPIVAATREEILEEARRFFPSLLIGRMEVRLV